MTKDEKDYLFQQVLDESEHLVEMSNLTKDDTGLPVNIWVDEGERFIKGKHWKRIKVQNDYGNKFNRYNTFSMSINQDLSILDNIDINVSFKDLKKIKEWIINNYELLYDLENIGISRLLKDQVKA